MITALHLQPTGNLFNCTFVIYDTKYEGCSQDVKNLRIETEPFNFNSTRPRRKFQIMWLWAERERKMERSGPENRMSGSGAGLEKIRWSGSRAEREVAWAVGRVHEWAESAAHNPLKPITIDWFRKLTYIYILQSISEFRIRTRSSL